MHAYWQVFASYVQKMRIIMYVCSCKDIFAFYKLFFLILFWNPLFNNKNVQQEMTVYKGIACYNSHW